MMRALVFIAATVALLAGPAKAQEWRAQSDADADMTAALAVWSTGHALVSRCEDGSLSVFLRLPQVVTRATDANLVLEGQGRRMSLDLPLGGQEGQVLFAREPARTARWLVDGGQLTVEVAGADPVVLDLPSNADPVRGAMTACETPLEDERDLLPTLEAINWVRRPLAMFPEEALRQGLVEGEVRLSCIVARGGRLDACLVEQESPAGLGFGHAAGQAALRAQLSPDTPEGVRVSFSIRFSMGRRR